MSVRDERDEAVVRDAEALLKRTRLDRGLPATVDDELALRRIAVLIETPVRSQQVAR